MSKVSDQSIQKQFGANLQKVRMAKGLSLRALAANCNLDDSNISKIEQGKFDIQLSTLFELAKGLGVNPKELLDIEINVEGI
jgi:transcriptional regulator with XRE-family HTH domain